MAYFLDFIKQSTTQSYPVVTRIYDVEKYGTEEKAQRAAISDYHEDMNKALDNENINYVNALVRDDEGGILVMDIMGSYRDSEESEE